MRVVSTFLATGWAYVLAGVLALNLYQRRHLEVGSRKRLATLYIAAAVAAFHFSGLAVVYSARLFAMEFDDRVLIPVAGLVGYLVWRYRARVWPFRSHCPRCRRRYPLKDVLFVDEPTCRGCRADGGSGGNEA